MKTWFVSVLHFPSDGAYYETIRMASEFENENQAKRFAALALARGSEVEAGTLPGVVPKVRDLSPGSARMGAALFRRSGRQIATLLGGSIRRFDRRRQR